MPVSLSKLTSETAQCQRSYGDDTLNITYRTRAVTVGRLEAMIDAARNDDANSIRDTAELLCEVVAKWDLLDDDGNPVPLTLSAVREVPWPVMQEVMDTIREDQSTDEGKAEASSGSG